MDRLPNRFINMQSICSATVKFVGLVTAVFSYFYIVFGISCNSFIIRLMLIVAAN